MKRHWRSLLGVKLLVLSPLVLLLVVVGASVFASLGSEGVASSQADASPLVLRVYFADRAERDRLAAELSPEEASTTGGYLTIVADQAAFDSLKARGIKVEVDQEQVRRHDTLVAQADADPKAFYGNYRTTEEVYEYMDQLVEAYPNLVEKVDIGDSWCKDNPGYCTEPDESEGYDLFVLHITNRDVPGPKPVFWLDSAMHSREIAGPEMSTRFMSRLLDEYDTDAEAHWLVDWHDIWVMPLVNPDGYHVVEPDSNRPFKQRKNADIDDGCDAYPPNNYAQFGTDLNRNFPFKWACCEGSSENACEQEYHGPEAGSEPETMALMLKLGELFPDQRGSRDADAAPITTTGIYQTFHSYAALNLVPWGWTDRPSPNSKDLINIGNHLGAANAYPKGNAYPACIVADCLYVTDGTVMDWLYGTLGVPSFSTELGGGDTFFPAYGYMDELWDDNKGMLIYMAKIAPAPYLLTRGPDADQLPGTIKADGDRVQIEARINYGWRGNAYRQNVAAAELYIDTPPWAGGRAIAMQATDGKFDKTAEEVNAEIDVTELEPGRHIVFVRGRGVNSYSGFPSWGPVTAAFLEVPEP